MASANRSINYPAGWMGLISIIVVFVATITVIGLTGWVAGTDSISKLGTRVDYYSLTFNISMILGGLLLIGYGAGRIAGEDCARRIGSTALALAGIAVVFFGVFPANGGNGTEHDIASYAALLLFIIAICANSFSAARMGGQRRIISGVGIFTVATIIITTCMCSECVCETVDFALILVWLAFDVAEYLGSGINFGTVTE